MGKSYRKTKIFGRAGDSDKYDKRKANRRLRRVVRHGRIDATIRDVSDTWSFSKDGKHYWEDATDRDMQK